MQLSPHFTLAELTVTSTGLANFPGDTAIANLRVLCMGLLEQIRWHTGPLTISSGFRTAAVNRAIGGSATSQHVTGEAADLMGADRFVIWRAILDDPRLPIDQAIIYEHKPHVHVSCVSWRPARREILAHDGSRYVAWGKYGGDLRTAYDALYREPTLEF